VRTLAQALAERGYRTGAFVSSFVLDARFGWDRGFEAFDDAFPVAGETFHSRTVREGGFWQEHRYEGFDRRAFDTTRAARRWLEGIPEPFFLFVHYFDPHDPYVPPKVYRERGESLAIDLSDRKLTGPGGSALPTLARHYHGEVMYVDDALGSLLDALDARGLADRTLVIVTADHGEGLGQHYWLNHLVYLYEEEVRVPWLVRLPGRVPAGLELATPVGLVDLAPTVAAFAGASLPDADGRSLAPALETGREPEPRPVLGMRQNFEKPYAGHLGDLQMWRTPRWKLLRGSVQQDELYDLDADPREQSNQIGARPDVFAELAAALDARLAQLPTHPAVAPLPDDVKRGLEALGYGTETPRPEKDR
jgi:arylsulfatase A-like enzyme